MKHTYTVEVETNDPFETLRALTHAVVNQRVDGECDPGAFGPPLGPLSITSTEFPSELSVEF